ncbi:MAG: hypothetical protein IJ838_07155 [Paludibacteraceae bacterium]|nr:hypothetical protein [Paludibacteraceae bacterium]
MANSAFIVIIKVWYNRTMRMVATCVKRLTVSHANSRRMDAAMYMTCMIAFDQLHAHKSNQGQKKKDTICSRFNHPAAKVIQLFHIQQRTTKSV